MIRRKVSVRPKTLSWIKYKKDGNTLEGFSFRHFWFRSRFACENFISTKQTLAAAWSEHDFAVVSKDAQQIVQLKEVYDQFDSLNIVIMLSGRSNPFGIVFRKHT